MPDDYTWSELGTNKRTWEAWCNFVRNQIEKAYIANSGCRSGVPELDEVLPNSNDRTFPKIILSKNMEIIIYLWRSKYNNNITKCQ